MNVQILHYQTAKPISECIKRILAMPQEYSDTWGGFLKYKAEVFEPSKLLVAFCGGQFRKIMRTQYLVEFTSETSYTSVKLYFLGELLGLPPLTPITDIDLFMEQKIAAFRCTNDGINSNRAIGDNSSP